MNTLKKAIQTEKSLLHARNGRYVFEVDLDATKHSVKAAVESEFAVKVKNISTITRKGKTKLAGRTRREKTLPNKKYAHITLKSGKIDIFPTE